MSIYNYQVIVAIHGFSIIYGESGHGTSVFGHGVSFMAVLSLPVDTLFKF